MTDNSVEVHVKYMGTWLCSSSKFDVAMEHVPHAVNMISLEIQKSLENVISGKLDPNKIPKVESHGKSIGVVMPDFSKDGNE